MEFRVRCYFLSATPSSKGILVVLPDSDLSSEPATDGRMEIVIDGDRRVIVNADVDGPALAPSSR